MKITSEKERAKFLLWSYINEGSEKSCREFYDLFFPRLIRYALIFVRSLEAADDVVSDVFVKFFQMGKKITEIDDLKYYLFRSVKNQSITFLKRTNPIVHYCPESDHFSDLIIDFQDPYQECLHNDLLNMLREIVNSLPQQKKTIYRLIVLEGFKYREVAELLSLSVKTVENHMCEANRQVRFKITKWLHENLQIAQSKA